MNISKELMGTAFADQDAKKPTPLSAWLKVWGVSMVPGHPETQNLSPEEKLPVTYMRIGTAALIAGAYLILK